MRYKTALMTSIIVALLAAMVLPALTPSGTAEAWSLPKPRVGCDTQELNFTAIKGVNPDSQTIGVYNAGTGTLWWKVYDNASWLWVWPGLGT